MSDLLWSVRCKNIHRKNTRKTVWVGGYSIGHIRIIVTVTSGSLYQSRPHNARMIHGGNHLIHAYGSFARPVGFVTADWCVRIAVGIGADHVRMDVDRHAVIRPSSPPNLRRHTRLSRRGPKEIPGAVLFAPLHVLLTASGLASGLLEC